MENLKDYKCPNCGGALEFNATTQKLKCPHCDGEFEVGLFEGEETLAVEAQTWDEDSSLVTYICKSCGGTIIVDKNTAASSCPYCGSPVVMLDNVTNENKPSRIIPFKYTKEQAKEQYKKHISGKFLLPNAFKSQAVIDEMKGVYVPFWLYDGEAHARMWFDASRSRTWSDGMYRYTETEYYKLFRAGSVKFNDVPVDASSKVNDILTESIEPFDANELKEFNDNYLVGYMADKYDIESEECKEKANKRIANSTQGIFASTTNGFINCVPTSSNISIANGKQEYVMMPVWLLNVKYQGKIYTFAMNGETGKFIGDLPADKKKQALLTVLSFVGTFIAALLIQFFVR